MLLLTGESPPRLAQVPNVMDAGMEPDTEFGPTPIENLLGVAAVVLRDIEQAGFTADETKVIAEHLIRFAGTMRGGKN